MALFIGNIDADLMGNLAGNLVWHFYALLLWDLPALLLRHLQIFDEQFSAVRNVHGKSQTVSPEQELYGSECLARHGSLHMAPKRFRESTTFKQIPIHLHRVLDWDIMAVFLRINFTVFVVAVPENLALRGCSEYCVKVGAYRG